VCVYIYRALLCVYEVLLSVFMDLVCVYRALLCGYKALLSVCMALLC